MASYRIKISVLSDVSILEIRSIIVNRGCIPVLATRHPPCHTRQDASAVRRIDNRPIPHARTARVCVAGVVRLVSGRAVATSIRRHRRAKASEGPQDKQQRPNATRPDDQRLRRTAGPLGPRLQNGVPTSDSSFARPACPKIAAAPAADGGPTVETP